MHPTLLRQFRRLFGSRPESIDVPELAALRSYLDATEAPLPLRHLADNLGDFLHRVEATYAQFERDLELRTRSLQLSSRELLARNDDLRAELDTREAVLRELQALAERLHKTAPIAPLDEAGDGRDGLQHLLYQIASLLDQQESRQAELQALHTDLANQKFALDQHAIVSITDLRGNIVYANDRFCQISGYARDELVGENHRIVKSGHHPDHLFAEMWASISAGDVWRGEVKNHAKDGSHYWVSATIVPLLDRQGHPQQYIAIRTDITARKRVEEELAAQLHFIEELIEKLPFAVYLKDPQGRYLRLNRAFESLFGIQREDWLGRTVTERFPEAYATEMRRLDGELMERGGIQTFEAEIDNRETGTHHNVLYRKARLTRPDGSVSGLIGSILDITDRKQAEEALREARRLAESANEAKSDFLANMSHEIRTPMNGILGMTELALDTDLDPTQRDYLNVVRNSAESLLVILNDILDFSKIEAGKMAIEAIPFNLPVTLTEALKPISARAELKGLRLVCDLPPELPEQVIGDPGRIRQILVNLCDNALKFTVKGEITVRATVAETMDKAILARISVTDTGIGISPDAQQRIFDAFTQADTSTTRRFGGTGLGLTICMRLVSLMGGRIWVESKANRGSTFHFTVRLGTHAPRGLRALPPLRTWPGERALIVDDQPLNRRTLVHWLEAWGFTVDEAASGVDGLARCRTAMAAQTPYRVICLDGHMPELDGFGFAEAMARERLATASAVIMLTSGGQPGDAQRCRQLGLGGYLSKPATPVELRETLTRLLGSPSDGAPPTAPTFITRHSLKEQQRRLTVLVVEDHAINQKLILDLLSKWGHAATLADNGQTALDLFSGTCWDLILMDMQMPVMGGLEATRKIRALETAGKRTPIIAMTANAMPEDRQRCLDAGMDDHVSKPINVKGLKRLIDHHCARMGTSRPDTPPPAASLFDDAVAAMDPDMLAAIAEAVLDQLPKDVAEADHALAGQDWPGLMRAAHNLKSTLAMFNLHGPREVARQIEQSPEDTPPELIDRLRAASDQLVAAIEQRLAP